MHCQHSRMLVGNTEMYTVQKWSRANGLACCTHTLFVWQCHFASFTDCGSLSYRTSQVWAIGPRLYPAWMKNEWIMHVCPVEQNHLSLSLSLSWSYFLFYANLPHFLWYVYTKEEFYIYIFIYSMYSVYKVMLFSYFLKCEALFCLLLFLRAFPLSLSFQLQNPSI